MTNNLLSNGSGAHPKNGVSRVLRVATDLDVSPDLAKKYIYGDSAINYKYAAILASDLSVGDVEAVAQWIAPASAAEANAPQLSAAEATYFYDCADVAEDAAQAELRRKPVETLTDAELETYIRAVAREAYRATQCLAALHRERRDRKERN